MTGPTDEFLPTRRSLLTRLKRWDDQESWREFFDTYGKLIYSAALQAGLSHADAEDVVQETVIGVARKMRGFRYDPATGSFKTWLLLNVRSRIIDHWRKENALKRRLEVHPEPQTGTGALEAIPDPTLNQLEAVWDREWQQSLLESALARVKCKVSAKEYLLFDLSAVKQRPTRQITSSLGVTAAQVYLARHHVGRTLKAEILKLERRMERGA